MIRARSDGPEWKSAPLKLPRTEADRRETVTKLGTKNYGGEGGIRTHGRISPTHAFQACSLNRSDTSPVLRDLAELQKPNKLGKRGQICGRAILRECAVMLRGFGGWVLQFCSLFRGGAIGSTWAFGA